METGAAHLLEHTLFKGTRTRGVGEADIAIENLGATLNASTGPDYARFYTSVPAEHAHEALSVLADVVRNATLPVREVDRERQVICDELSQRDSDADGVLIDQLYAAAFRDEPYGRPPGGTLSAIRSRTRESLVDFYKRNYTPARSVLIVVGDITPDRAREIALRAFGDWTGPARADKHRAEELHPVGPSLESPDREVRSGSVEGAREPDAAPHAQRQFQWMADVARPVVAVAYFAPAARDAGDACAIQIVATMLGRSEFGGRLSVTRLSGCDARVSYSPRREVSLLVVSARLPETAAGPVRKREDLRLALAGEQAALASVVDGLLSTAPSAAELLAAKGALRARAVVDNETDTGLAAAIGNAAIAGGQTPEEWRAGIDAVTLVEVRQCISRWLGPQRRMAAAIVPRSMPIVPDAGR